MDEDKLILEFDGYKMYQSAKSLMLKHKDGTVKCYEGLDYFVIVRLIQQIKNLTNDLKEFKMNKDSKQFEKIMLGLLPDVENEILNMIDLHKKKSKDSGNKWAQNKNTSILEMFYGGIKRPFSRLENFAEKWLVGIFEKNVVASDNVLDYLRDIAIYAIMFYVVIKNDHLNLNRIYFKELIKEHTDEKK